MYRWEIFTVRRKSKATMRTFYERSREEQRRFILYNVILPVLLGYRFISELYTNAQVT